MCRGTAFNSPSSYQKRRGRPQRLTRQDCESQFPFSFLQVDWEEYYGHYVRTLLRLDDRTIQDLKSSPQTVSRPVKVIYA